MIVWRNQRNKLLSQNDGFCWDFLNMRQMNEVSRIMNSTSDCALLTLTGNKYQLIYHGALTGAKVLFECLLVAPENAENVNEENTIEMVSHIESAEENDLK